MGHELDSTLANLPSYAELSQTQAWQNEVLSELMEEHVQLKKERGVR
jgi:hypothetical protein